MKYPEKYPLGFTIAADHADTLDEAETIIKAGAEYYLRTLEDALNDHFSADTFLILAACHIYCDMAKKECPEAEALKEQFLKAFNWEGFCITTDY